jgi:hypothetical protein
MVAFRQIEAVLHRVQPCRRVCCQHHLVRTGSHDSAADVSASLISAREVVTMPVHSRTKYFADPTYLHGISSFIGGSSLAALWTQVNLVESGAAYEKTRVKGVWARRTVEVRVAEPSRPEPGLRHARPLSLAHQHFPSRVTQMNSLSSAAWLR